MKVRKAFALSLALFISLLLLPCIVPTTALAESEGARSSNSTVKQDGLVYSIYGDHAEVVGEYEPRDTYAISSYVSGKPVTVIKKVNDYGYWGDAKQASAVTIPNTVKKNR